MNCRKIQEFIITDYIDGQMPDKQKDFIDQHLASCHACKGYLNIIKEKAVDPLVNAPQGFPDKALWSLVKQSIDEEQDRQLEKSLRPGFFESLSAAVHIPRPAFVFATVITMVLMIGSTGQLFFSPQPVKING